MTKTKVTKKALASSFLALMLCVSMLLGATYAWFTDNVTSTGNIIKSGTLDVSMKWADGTEDPSGATWTDAASGAIFNYDLWEPGYTEVRHIKISNDGTLALKYKVQIVANGTVSDLADVIDVYYMDPAEQIADRAALATKTPMGTLTQALAGMDATAAGRLAAGEADTITIALKMQESAGNEYQDKSIGTDFSIQLLATQDTVEADSFDDQYDAAAEFPWTGEADTSWFNAADTDVTLSTPAQLAGLAQMLESGETFQGKTVKLDSDIDLNNVLWTPIGVFNGTNFSKAFKGTFDGQGHTVSNLNVSTTGAAGLFGEVYGGTIKNLTVDNANVYSNRMAAAIVGQLYGNLENCHVTNSNVTGVPNEDGSTYDNGDKIGGLVGWIGDNGNNRHITDCSASNVTLRAYRDVGGLAGHIQKSTSITGCTVENISITVDKLTNAYGNSSINAGYLYGRAADASTNTLENNTETGTNTTNVLQ